MKPRPRVNPALNAGGYALAGTMPRDHLKHAWCGDYRHCVPDWLHGEFLAVVGGDPDTKGERLREFYAATMAAIPEGEALEPDDRKFWRPRFTLYFKPKPATPTGATGAPPRGKYDGIRR